MRMVRAAPLPHPRLLEITGADEVFLIHAHIATALLDRRRTACTVKGTQ